MTEVKYSNLSTSDQREYILAILDNLSLLRTINDIGEIKYGSEKSKLSIYVGSETITFEYEDKEISEVKNLEITVPFDEILDIVKNPLNTQERYCPRVIITKKDNVKITILQNNVCPSPSFELHYCAT